MPELKDIVVVEDRTDRSSCTDGFLRLSRLTVRNVYDDGSSSEPYPCDIVHRPSSDAMAVVLFHRQGRRVHVILKEGIRPPIYLRKLAEPVRPDPRLYDSIIEIVAGLIEPEDAGAGGLEQRAWHEAREEVGFDIDRDRVHLLGGESFASPGTSDEKVYFGSVEVPRLVGGQVTGDGTPMEAGQRPVVLELTEAIERCRDGRIPDLKTEVALLRLADQIGYLPQLDLFVSELPTELRSRHRSLGVRGLPEEKDGS